MLHKNIWGWPDVLGDKRDSGHWWLLDESSGDDSRLGMCTERAVKDVGYEACRPFLDMNTDHKIILVMPSSMCWAVSPSICGERNIKLLCAALVAN